MKLFFLLISLFISRVLFLSPFAIYFDGPEYVRLINNPNLLAALTQGHEPIHPGYILLSWILNRTLPLGPVYSAELTSAFFAALGLFIFYKIAILLFDKKIALKSLIIASLLPVLFLSGVNVLTDSTYIFFYLFSFYLLLRYFKTKENKWFIFGILSFAYSIFTHTQVVLWVPLFFAPVLLSKRSKIQTMLKQILMFIFVGGAIGVLSLILLLTLIGNSFHHSFTLLFMHGSDFITSSNPITAIGMYIRNFGITLLRNNSTIVILASIFGFILLFKRDKKKLGILLLWILPVLITTQYWHIGLFGRVSLLASFPLAILAAQIKSRFIFGLIILQLIIITVPLAISNRNATIQGELNALYNSIPKGSVLISSNLIRPQVTFIGEKYFINEPGQDTKFIEEKIDLALKNGKKAYIDSQALYNPYFSYDGNHLHILSLGKTGSSEILPIFEKYETEIVSTRNNPRIFLYQVRKKSLNQAKYNFSYTDDFQGRIHPQRIDYRDLGTWFWVILSNKTDPVSWKID